MNDFSLGLIGYGTIGEVHFKAIHQTQGETGLSVAVVADINDVNFPKGVRFTKDYKALLQNPSIDAIAIATPPDTHFGIARDALIAGKDVLLEKPPTLTIPELEKLEDISTNSERVLFTAFHAMYRPEVDEARKLLKGETVKSIDIEYREYVLNYHDADGWIFKKQRGGGGVLIDSGINALSIVARVLPQFKSTIKNVSFGYSEGIEVETSVNMKFAFLDSGIGTLNMDWMHKGSEVRKVTFTTNSNIAYTVDIINAVLRKDNEVVLGSHENSNEKADQHSEYREIYRDFTSHLRERKSYVSKKELELVLDAYTTEK